jgi:2,3-bisphosphoglycerate-independent phosphoglycerate mutase
MAGKRAPLVWIILDGFGEAPPSDANAITLAEPRFYLELRERYPFGLLDASGESVGLPCGLMGNSEVGHLNMGAGRIVWQEITRIDRAIASGEFARLPAFVDAFEHVQRSGGAVHLMGLVSDGGVHSSDRHLEALLEMARRAGLDGRRLFVHAFLDGRDTPPRSAQRYVAALEKRMGQLGVGRIATVVGRYFAMDRDKRWDRVARAHAALTAGEGLRAESAQAAIEAAYARDEGDEFVQATVIGDPKAGRMRNGDSVIFFNFRADRARQLTEAFLARDFAGFPRRAQPEVYYATMTRYRADFRCPVAFQPQYLRGIFPELVSRAGLSQLRIAETEKYAHVTFFMSGGDEKEYPGERRVLIPSPKVATYDLQPEMSAREVTDALLRELDTNRPDVTILNFANADMVGHTGCLEPAVRAVRTLDQCLARIVPRVLRDGGHVLITADHGNCEMMVDPETGKPHTAHTTNPVPFLMVGKDLIGRTVRGGGRLCDIATTLLPMLGLAPDPSMEGVNLL